MARVFFAHRGREVHKWVHYLDAYDRYFSRFRGTPLRMLEIGVYRGGSLQLWLEYFGADATIFGIDIDPSAADYATPPAQVRIGSQNDPAFLRSVVAEMGGVDLILDDGSHVGEHQITSFKTLFPLLSEGGIYAIEDLHTSYWRSHEGGHQRRGTGIEFVKQMIDDMHAWYHPCPVQTPARDWVQAIHMHDSLVMIEKARVSQPGHIRIS